MAYACIQKTSLQIYAYLQSLAEKKIISKNQEGRGGGVKGIWTFSKKHPNLGTQSPLSIMTTFMTMKTGIAKQVIIGGKRLAHRHDTDPPI